MGHTHTKWTAMLLLTATALTTIQTDTDNRDAKDATKTDDETNTKLRLNKISNVEGKQREILDLSESMMDDAGVYGIQSMENLVNEKEPQWYKMGLFLDKHHPASYVANFGAPNQKALTLSRFGYAALEATRKIAEIYPNNVGRESGFPESVQSRLLQDECPLRGSPRCTAASRRYRTADGTCNNLEKPWKGSVNLPMQRFLPPVYEDGIQTVRRSVFDHRLPSARAVSTRLHRDKNREIQTVTLMFMQWGQFIDHDVTSVVKSRSFNGSVPRCCDAGGRRFLPPDLTHPACLPIEIPDDDFFFSQFRIRCMEFIRSAPSTRIDCDLGWREQINQNTPFIDGSAIYGSDIETSDSTRTFRNGKLFYGRPQGSTNPPDPPGGELCRAGALTTDCLQLGDGRASEQPGLTAIHTTWVRYHNKIATILSQINPHWSDEKVFQETRRIVYSVIQHITYREFLPLVLGQEVMELFELNLLRKGYYEEYDGRINPAIANAFSAAAFRFGHSMVQNSYVRADSQHRPIFNNVSLHEDFENPENIWSFGSVDRLLLGFLNQPSQRRDEFIAKELTNHLFQFSDSAPFGMDLAAINIQRGRDHGLPPYTAWRKPCGLSAVTSFKDLEEIMSFEAANRFKSLYEHVDDIDLFSAGLAEKPLRGGIVGPTFACIIAQQFLNLRKGDRFWYENGGFESSFTPAQLQQIRHVSLAQILCQTMEEIETIQPFVFLSPDNFRNVRVSCDSSLINNFDLLPWQEKDFRVLKRKRSVDCKSRKKRRKTPLVRPANLPSVSATTARPTTSAQIIRTTKKVVKKKPTQEPLKIQVTNITTSTVKLENKYGTNNQVNSYNVIPDRPTYDNYATYYNDDKTDVTYLFGIVSQKATTPKPLELNIKIQYYLPTSTTKRPNKRKKTKTPTYVHSNNNYPVFVQQQDNYDSVIVNRPSDNYYNYNNRPTNLQDTRPYHDNFYDTKTTTRRTYVIRPTSYYDNYGYNSQYQDQPFSTTQRPYRPQFVQNLNEYHRDDPISEVYSQLIDDGHSSVSAPMKPTFGQNFDDKQNLYVYNRPNKFFTVGHVEKLDDKLDFKTRLVYNDKRGGGGFSDSDDDRRFVKISSVRDAVQAKDGDLDLEYEEKPLKKLKLVDIQISPSEIGEDHWLIYNATDEEMPLLQIPEINSNISCSVELPKPMKMTKT